MGAVKKFFLPSAGQSKVSRVKPRHIGISSILIEEKGIQHGHKLYRGWEKHFGKAIFLLKDVALVPSLAGKNKNAFLDIFPESIRRYIHGSRRFTRLGNVSYENPLEGLFHDCDLMVGPAENVCGFIRRLGEFSRKWRNAPKGTFEKIFGLFALNHPEGTVRISALLELEKLAGKKAEPVFEKSLGDPDFKVRHNTMLILSRIKSFRLLKKAWEKEKNFFLWQEAFNLLDANNK